MISTLSKLRSVDWSDADIALGVIASVAGTVLEGTVAARFLALSCSERQLAAERVWIAERYLNKQLIGIKAAALLQVSYPYFQKLAYRWRDNRDPTGLIAFKTKQVRTSRTPHKEALIDAAFDVVVKSGQAIKPSTVTQAMAKLDPTLAATIGAAYVTQRFGKLIADAPSGIPLLPRRYWSANTMQAFGRVMVLDQVKIDRWWTNEVGDLDQLRIDLIIDAHTRLILAWRNASSPPSPGSFKALLCALKETIVHFGPCVPGPVNTVFQLEADPGWASFAEWAQRAGFIPCSRRIPGLNSGALARRLLGANLAVLKIGNRNSGGKRVHWSDSDIHTQLPKIIAAHNSERLSRHPNVNVDRLHASAPPYSLALKLIC